MRHSNDHGYGICPVCFEGLLGSPQETDGDYYAIDCPRCGKFDITRTAASMFNRSPVLGQEGSRVRANLSAWLRERNPQEMLDSAFLNQEKPDGLGYEFWSIKTPTFSDRANKLLLALERRTDYAGCRIDWYQQLVPLIAEAWVLNADELVYIMKYLRGAGYISGGVIDAPTFDDEDGYVATSLVIGPDGWEKISELSSMHVSSKQGFVAMWFDPIMKPIYDNYIARAIHAAGFSPLRIDNKDHINKVDDEIIKEIKGSRFIVADFTEHRGGVYYEAGYAMGLGLPVIWTCRADHLKDLHFDIRQYNCLVWESDKLDLFAKRLQDRIEALFGKNI